MVVEEAAQPSSADESAGKPKDKLNIHLQVLNAEHTSTAERAVIVNESNVAEKKLYDSSDDGWTVRERLSSSHNSCLCINDYDKPLFSRGFKYSGFIHCRSMFQ